MTEIEEDIQGTKILLETINNHHFSKYDKIYYSTNEELNKILKNTDIKNKKVLTVQASGDQPLYFLYNGAKEVDTFDINKLTFYHYILKIWFIRYLNVQYHNIKNINIIKELLLMVEPQNENEQKAYKYWHRYIDEIYSIYMLYTNKFGTRPNLFQNLACLKEINTNFNFYNVDITKQIDIDKKYDIIYTSNIFEYIYKEQDVIAYRDNSDKLLNEKGIIISSCVIGKHIWQYERKIMEEKFICEPIKDEYTNVGYYYIKKRI